MQRVWQSDLTTASAVRKGEVLGFLDVFEMSTCFSNLQLSQACAPSTWKFRVSCSAVIPVELRHALRHFYGLSSDLWLLLEMSLLQAKGS